MKGLTGVFLFLSLFSIIGCDTTDDLVIDETVVEVNQDPKLYTTRIGTYIKTKNDDYEYSDSRGSLILKRADGSSLLAAELSGSVHGEVTYEITNLDGQKYTRRELISSAFRTDVNGDFSTDILYDTFAKEAVSAIKKLNITVSVIENDIAYEKSMNYSDESVWDVAMGLGTAIFEYDIVQHHSIYRSYDNELIQYFDINKDIELTEAVDQYSAKTAVRSSKITKRD